MDAKVGDTITVDGKNYVAGDDGNWHPVEAAKHVSIEPPGIADSFKRGIYRSPANVLGMADSMRRRVSMIPGVDGPEPLSQVMDQGQIARSGVGEPQGLLPQVAERIGMQAPLSAGGLAATGAAGGAWALKDALIQDVASNVASQYVQNRGFGKTGQIVSGVLAAMFVPTRLPGFIANRFGNATEEAAQSPIRTLSDSEVAKLAKQYDVKPDDMREVAKIVQDRVIIDPITGKPKIDELVDQIDETMRLFPNPKVRPTFAQAAGKYGGANYVALENETTLTDAVANSRSGGIRDAVQADLSQRWDDLIRDGSTDGALEKFSALRDAEKAAKAQAWNEVPFDDLPKSPAAPLVRALDSIKKTRSLLYRNTPSDIKDTIENLGDEVTARDLQDLRARLGEVIEEGRSATDRSGQLSAESARQLFPVVDDALKRLPDDGSTAYRRAVAATKSYYDTFPGEAEAVKAFSKLKDRDQIAGTVLRAKDKVGQIEVAMNIFGKTEGGMDDLRSIFMRHLVGNDIGEKPMSSIAKALNNEGTTAVYKKLLGPEDFSTLKDILKAYQIGMSGTSGTAAQIAKTQSSQLVQRLTAFASAPGQTIKGAAKAVDEAITRDAASEAARKGVINELVFDLDLGRKLLRVPTERASETEVNSWLKSWSVAVARSAIRTQARAANRAPAITRAAVGPMVVNQSFPGQGLGGVR